MDQTTEAEKKRSRACTHAAENSRLYAQLHALEKMDGNITRRLSLLLLVEECSLLADCTHSLTGAFDPKPTSGMNNKIDLNKTQPLRPHAPVH